jgi:TonB-dependent starch-binding outer membrane protein SusC
VQKLRSTLLALLTIVIPTVVYAQERTTVTGQVFDSNRQPLAGAVITIPSLRLVTTSNERGQFSLGNVPPGQHTVQVSLLGYKTQSMSLTAGSGTAPLSVALATDPLKLDEMVVVGYGEQRRSQLAGSVASLKPETVKETPTTSIQQVMQGRMPGVQIVQNSGTPGAAMTVRVRGNSSIGAGNAPLYVVDGVPMVQGDFNFGWVGFGGQDIDAISDLNPNEIEDIQVLKDASAAAIYGSRASNGVVLIRTKHGISAAKPEVSFNTYYGTQKTWRRLDMLNADQYTEVYNEGCVARYGAPCVTYTDQPVAPAPVGSTAANFMRRVRGVDTDWLSEVLSPSAPIRSVDAGIRGGTEKVRYYVSGSMINQDGIQRSEAYKRMNGRINLDYNPYNKLSIGTNVALAHSSNERSRNDNTIYGAFANAIASAPIIPVYDPVTGKYYDKGFYASPVGMLNEARSRDRSIRIIGNTFADYGIIPGVNARASVGLDSYTLRSDSWDSPAFAQGPWGANGGMVGVGNSFVNKLTYEGTVNFNRALGQDHEFSGVVGGSYEKNTREQDAVQGTNFPNEFFKYITSAATISGGDSRKSDWGMTSLFGRLSYTFDDKITVTGNVRRDGSSRFGANNRFGTFPSVSVLYRMTDEGYFKSQPVFSNLALRVSYGLTGNQNGIGDFESRGLFGGGSNYADQPGIGPTQLANPDLKWEKTKQLRHSWPTPTSSGKRRNS